MRFQTEDAEGANNAREAEVVVVEARDPVAGGGAEIGARDDGDGCGVARLGLRLRMWIAGFEAVEAEEPG